jgi:hypothetical protein
MPHNDASFVSNGLIRVRLPRFLAWSLPILFCVATAALAAEDDVAEAVTPSTYARLGAKRGVVLMSVRWDRRWWCGQYENAQLSAIAFDKLPTTKKGAARPDILLNGTSLIATRPEFENYAFLVEPGEYALAGVQMKIARSAQDVGTLVLARDSLLPGGQPKGGKFSVGAGEIVYIGHFYIECLGEPTLWRFYADGREAYDQYLDSLKEKLPMLDLRKAQFRLFQTNDFGQSYELK